MSISTNYSTPVMLNGFSCRNCSEVDQAKRNIDPANPSAGPFGMNAPKSGSASKTHKSASIDSAAVQQAVDQVAGNKGSNVHRAYSGAPVPGQLLHLTV